MSWTVNVDMGIFMPVVAFFAEEKDAREYAENARRKGAVSVSIEGE